MAAEYFNLPLSIQRLNPVPVEKTILWNSYVDALNYALTDSTAYIGQLLSVYDTSEDKLSDQVTVYTIVATKVETDAEGKEVITKGLQEVGSGSGVAVVDSIPADLSSYDPGQIFYEKGTGKLHYVLETTTQGEEDEAPVTTKITQGLLTTADLSGTGVGDMTMAQYDTNKDGKVNSADVADRVANSLLISNGSTTTKTFDGSSSVSVTAADLGALTASTLPIATSSALGGVKSSTGKNYILVDQNTGLMTINTIDASKIEGVVSEAGKTTGSLTIKHATDSEKDVVFNGSESKEISAETLGAITELPIASSTEAGIVKVNGDGLAVDSEGKLSIDSATLPKASTTSLGAVKVGTGLAVDDDGTLRTDFDEYSLPIATKDILGGIKPDQASILVDSQTGVASVGTVDATKISGTVASATDATNATNYKKTDGSTGNIETDLGTKQEKSTLLSDVKTGLAGVEGGFAPLDSSRKISSEYLPGYVDDVLVGEYVNETTFKVNGVGVTLETGIIYIDNASGVEYRAVEVVVEETTTLKLIEITNPLDFATTSEATDGTSTTKVMTPARTKEAIQASAINVSQLFVADGDTLILKCGDSNF